MNLRYIKSLPDGTNGVMVIGRVEDIRYFGESVSGVLYDGFDSILFLASKAVVGDAFMQFMSSVRSGDLIMVAGVAGTSENGRKTIYADTLRIEPKTSEDSAQSSAGITHSDYRKDMACFKEVAEGMATLFSRYKEEGAALVAEIRSEMALQKDAEIKARAAGPKSQNGANGYEYVHYSEPSAADVEYCQAFEMFKMAANEALDTDLMDEYLLCGNPRPEVKSRFEKRVVATYTALREIWKQVKKGGV
jgi:hypothetical protein